MLNLQSVRGFPPVRDHSPPIRNINPLSHFNMVGDFSQTDCNFNSNINVTVDSYMNSSFNLSFLHLLKILLASRIMKLGSTSKMMAQLETIPQCLLFFSRYSFIFDKQA